MTASDGQVKVSVLAEDPAGNGVAFTVSGWRAAHAMKQRIESYHPRTYGWKYVAMARIVTQRELL